MYGELASQSIVVIDTDYDNCDHGSVDLLCSIRMIEDEKRADEQWLPHKKSRYLPQVCNMKN